jgi:hypothetical protein
LIKFTVTIEAFKAIRGTLSLGSVAFEDGPFSVDPWRLPEGIAKSIAVRIPSAPPSSPDKPRPFPDLREPS